MKNKFSFSSFAALLISITFFYTLSYGESISTAGIKPVSNIVLTRYAGKWYEIARLPLFFENGLDHVTATYTLRKDGQVDVLNEGLNNGSRSSVRGIARVIDTNVPARLSVNFFLWFGSDYLVFDLDETNYQYAMVTSGTKDFLWILSRTPKMDPVIYNKLINSALSNGFSLSNLIVVKQD